MSVAVKNQKEAIVSAVGNLAEGKLFKRYILQQGNAQRGFVSRDNLLRR